MSNIQVELMSNIQDVNVQELFLMPDISNHPLILSNTLQE